MAYATKYLLGTVPYANTGDKIEIVVSISEQDYTGDVISLNGAFDTFQINRDFSDLESPILGVSFQFSIVNDFDDWFTLLDLMTATEGKYLVEVKTYVNKIQDVTLFSGYLNTENSEQKLVQYQTLDLVASSYLSKLKNYSPSYVGTLQNQTFIDIILNMLSELGSSSNVRVNSSLVPEEDWGIQNITEGNPGYTLFNKVGFFTELFWLNNVEIDTSYDILESILKTCNCYIYWWDGYWYIEHHNNIWATIGVKSFVEYDITQDYTITSFGIWSPTIARVITDIHDLVFTELTQTLYVVPGSNQVAITIAQDEFDNLVPSALSGTTEQTSVTPVLLTRQWARYKEIGGDIDWDNSDVAYKDIEYGVMKTNADINAFPSDYKQRGLYCNFKVSVLDATTLSITWKYNVGSAKVSLDLAREELREDVPINVIAYYGLRFIGIGTGGQNAILVQGDDDTGWFLADEPDYPTSPITVLNMPSVETTYAQFDEDTGTYTFSISIDLFDINENLNTGIPVVLPFSGDYEIQLVIGEVVFAVEGGDKFLLANPRFGDIEVTVSGDEDDDNYIEGTTNTDFINKTSISVDLADQSDLKYKSAILRGGTTAAPLTERTSLWRSKYTGDTAMSIIDRLLQDKFRFYNVSRQKITGNIYDTKFWRPFSLFQDSKQSDKKFVLMGFTHKLTLGAYDLTLLEYDNETEVNLIEED